MWRFTSLLYKRVNHQSHHLGQSIWTICTPYHSYVHPMALRPLVRDGSLLLQRVSSHCPHHRGHIYTHPIVHALNEKLATPYTTAIVAILETHWPQLTPNQLTLHPVGQFPDLY
jgi:hypothetical protein